MSAKYGDDGIYCGRKLVWFWPEWEAQCPRCRRFHRKWAIWGEAWKCCRCGYCGHLPSRDALREEGQT